MCRKKSTRSYTTTYPGHRGLQPAQVRARGATTRARRERGVASHKERRERATSQTKSSTVSEEFIHRMETINTHSPNILLLHGPERAKPRALASTLTEVSLSTPWAPLERRNRGIPGKAPQARSNRSKSSCFWLLCWNNLRRSVACRCTLFCTRSGRGRDDPTNFVHSHRVILILVSTY